MITPKIITLRLRHYMKSKLGLYPAPYFYLAKVFGDTRWKERLVDIDTELVIEGYPRSANTFSVVAFEMAQKRDVKLAHHRHVPAQIVKAVKLGLPTLVLIREPKLAVASLLVLYPWLPIKNALENYYDFYKTILPYSRGFIVAPFDKVTENFGEVIQRVNNKFNTAFGVFEHTSENVQICFQKVEERGRLRAQLRDLSLLVATPNKGKDEAKRKILPAFDQSDLQPLLKKCQSLYMDFIDESNMEIKSNAS